MTPAARKAGGAAARWGGGWGVQPGFLRPDGGSEAPGARTERSRRAGGAWRARGGPRVGFPGAFWGAKLRQRHPPTRRPCVRWALRVRARLRGAEAAGALRAAPGPGARLRGRESTPAGGGRGVCCSRAAGESPAGSIRRIGEGIGRGLGGIERDWRALGGAQGHPRGARPSASLCCEAILWVARRWDVAREPLAPSIHMDGRVSGRQALICLQALEPGRRVRICNICNCNAKEWLCPARGRLSLSREGLQEAVFAWWRAIHGGFREGFAHTSPLPLSGL